jgi:hypothetical protein
MSSRDRVYGLRIGNVRKTVNLLFDFDRIRRHNRRLHRVELGDSETSRGQKKSVLYGLSLLALLLVFFSSFQSYSSPTFVLYYTLLVSIRGRSERGL